MRDWPLPPPPRRAFPSALRWGAVAFLVAGLLGGVIVGVCAKRLCLLFLPKWLVALMLAYVWLAAPWLALGALGSRHALAPAPFSVIVSLASAASIALLVFLARYAVLRFRNFMAAPLPHDDDPPYGPDDRRLPAGSPLLTLATLVLVLAFTFLRVLWSHGLDPAAWKNVALVSGILVVLVMIPFYFEVRRSRRPDKLELALAFAWLALRRVTCGIAVLLFAGGGVAMLRGGMTGTGLLMFVPAALFVWWGWVGAGESRRFGDDRRTDRARRRRYGWK